MIEDRKWCARTFLHAYAVGFPDVSGHNRRVGGAADCGMVEEEKLDTEQEWHCCICPLTPELRTALSEMTPKDDKARELMKTIADCGLLDVKHEAVHVMGTDGRKADIDDKYFPWSSDVNPIEMGDLGKPRDTGEKGGPKGRGKGKGKSRDDDGPRPKPRRGPLRGRGPSSSPRRAGSDGSRPRGPLRKRMR